MRCLSIAIAVALPLLSGGLSAASAEEDEWRLGVHGATASVSMSAFGTEADTFGAGGGVELGHGLRDWFEIGLSATYLTRPNTTLTDPELEGVFASGLMLYTDAHWALASMTARFVHVGGRPALFTILHPTLEVRVGGGLRMLRAPEAFNANGSLVASPDAQTDIVLFAGARAGITYRWTDRLQVGLLGGFSTGTQGHQSIGAQFELTWQTYSLF